MGYGPEEAADSASEAMIALYTSAVPVLSPDAWVAKVAMRDAARNAARRKRTEQTEAAVHHQPVARPPPREPLDRLLLDLLE